MAEVMEVNLNGCLYIATVESIDDIAACVRENHVESLQSSDGGLQFWFSPQTNHRINRCAAEILWTYTEFEARTVPLLRGNVIVTARNPQTGQPQGLTSEQFHELGDAGPHGRERRILARRCVRELRRQQRAATAPIAVFPGVGRVDMRR